MILADTNVLVYSVNSASPFHEESRAFLEAGWRGVFRVVLVSQVLLEFYAVVTSGRVERPLAPQAALEQINIFRSMFPVLETHPGAMEVLVEILSRRPSVRGGNIFDAWLVAQMKTLNITVVCTYNVADFSGYEGVVAHRPGDFLIR